MERWFKDVVVNIQPVVHAEGSTDLRHLVTKTTYKWAYVTIYAVMHLVMRGKMLWRLM